MIESVSKSRYRTESVEEESMHQSQLLREVGRESQGECERRDGGQQRPVSKVDAQRFSRLCLFGALGRLYCNQVVLLWLVDGDSWMTKSVMLRFESRQVG